MDSIAGVTRTISLTTEPSTDKIIECPLVNKHFILKYSMESPKLPKLYPSASVSAFENLQIATKTKMTSISTQYTLKFKLYNKVSVRPSYKTIPCTQDIFRIFLNLTSCPLSSVKLWPKTVPNSKACSLVLVRFLLT